MVGARQTGFVPLVQHARPSHVPVRPGAAVLVQLSPMLHELADGAELPEPLVAPPPELTQAVPDKVYPVEH